MNSPCLFCGNRVQLVYVHGHYQCRFVVPMLCDFFLFTSQESMCSDIGDAPFNIKSLGNFYRSENLKAPVTTGSDVF